MVGQGRATFCRHVRREEETPVKQIQESRAIHLAKWMVGGRWENEHLR